MPEVAPEAIALDNATSKSQLDTTKETPESGVEEHFAGHNTDPSNALVDDTGFFASHYTDGPSSEWW
jgi:hypothetical protein